MTNPWYWTKVLIKAMKIYNNQMKNSKNKLNLNIQNNKFSMSSIN